MKNNRRGLHNIFALVMILIFATSMTGCVVVDAFIEGVEQGLQEEDPIFEEQMKTLIDEESIDTAFEQVQQKISADVYPLVTMNNIATFFMDAGEVEEALYILEILDSKFPNEDSVLNNLSWAFNDMGKYALANYYADGTLAIEPNEAIEYVNKGTALYGLDRIEEALAAYTEGVTLEPDQPFAVWGVARMLYELERYEEAIPAFEKYASLDVDDAHSIDYYVAQSYLEMNQVDKALGVYQAAFDKDPTNTSPLYSMGDLYMTDLKDYKSALGYYQQIAQIDSQDAWAYFNMAVCLGGLGDKVGSAKELEKAIALDSEIKYEIEYYDELK